MRIWSILLIESDLKWCIHRSRSLFSYPTERHQQSSTVVTVGLWALMRTKQWSVGVTNERKPPISTYTIHGVPQASVKTAKYLGLNISTNLSWTLHIDQVANNANNTNVFLRRNISTCPSKIKEQCYRIMVRPIMEYACVVWDPITQIEMVQRRAASFVYGDYRITTSVRSMLRNLEWDTLKLRRQQIKFIMLFRVIDGLVALSTKPYLVPKGASTTTGDHNLRLLVHYSRVQYYQHSCFPSTIRLWNILPDSVATASSLEGFKERLHHIQPAY